MFIDTQAANFSQESMVNPVITVFLDDTVYQCHQALTPDKFEHFI